MGRAALLAMMGFGVVLLSISSRSLSVSHEAADKAQEYYNSIAARNIANSGTSLAASYLWQNRSWRGWLSLPFAGGTLSASATQLAGDTVRIETYATYRDETATTSVLLRSMSFSQFQYYSVLETTPEGNPIYWADGEQMTGPLHTEDNLYITERGPEFYGRVTLHGTVNYKNGKYDKKKNKNGSEGYFYGGGPDPGISVPMPGEWDALSDHLDVSKNFVGNDDVYLEFEANGKVRYRVGSEEYHQEDLTSFTQNGIIYVKGGNVHVKGTLKGQITIVADSLSPTSGGTVYIDDNLRYAHDPRTDPSSTDVLGIVAKNKVLISKDYNPTGGKDNIDIQASIFCQKEGFGAEDATTRPDEGYINLLGGIQQYRRGVVGLVSGRGFSKNYVWDTRLQNLLPPWYPGTRGYFVLSWFE
jgi:hypothetical protein